MHAAASTISVVLTLVSMVRSGSYDANGFFAESNPGAKKPAPCFIMAKVTGGKYVRFDSPKSGFRCNDGAWFTP